MASSATGGTLAAGVAVGGAWWWILVAALVAAAGVAGWLRWRRRSSLCLDRRIEARVEARLRERTADLTRRIDELERTNAVLEEASERGRQTACAQSEFLAAMGHEIRTPMNGVVGMTALLLETELTPEQREQAETVRSCADAVLSVTHDILDFSELEAGRMRLEAIPFDLQILLEKVIELVAPRGADRDVELDARYEPDAPRRFLADAGRIRQILVYLLGNALRRTYEGHVAIDVRCLRSEDGVAAMRWTVEDCGPPIPDAMRESIFDPVVPREPRSSGSGGPSVLGLSVARRLVDAMGGRIGVDCDGRDGATFWFELELPVDTAPVTRSLPAAELRGVRVLVVDDHPLNRRLLEERMAGWGMRVVECAGAEAALALLRQASRAGDPFEIAVIDSQMPHGGGAALAREVKRDPGIASTVLVMLTSVGMQGDARRMRRLGIAGYLLKPVTHDQLQATLEAVWGACTEGREIDLVTRHTLAESGGRTEDDPSAGRLRVLVAEDNAVNQRLAVLILERLGCAVDLAVNGMEAVEMVGRDVYDVVFMDCQMPLLDGFEATRQIRERGGRMPVVAMTAHAESESRARCLEAGMDDSVSKPIRPQRIEKILMRWCAEAYGTLPVEEPSSAP